MDPDVISSRVNRIQMYILPCNYTCRASWLKIDCRVHSNCRWQSTTVKLVDGQQSYQGAVRSEAKLQTTSSMPYAPFRKIGHPWAQASDPSIFNMPAKSLITLLNSKHSFNSLFSPLVKPYNTQNPLSIPQATLCTHVILVGKSGWSLPMIHCNNLLCLLRFQRNLRLRHAASSVRWRNSRCCDRVSVMGEVVEVRLVRITSRVCQISMRIRTVASRIAPLSISRRRVRELS